MEKFGLVLSGGGSKGAYEIGVYKALRRLHMKIDIVTGTSIGAMNGVFIAQKDLWGALKFWRRINFSSMYREEDFPPMDDKSLVDIYKQYAKTFINEGGIDVSKMEIMFDSYFKPRRFFKSNIDYGLVTYNLSKKKPVMMTKKDLNFENAKGYIFASASCYPAFKPYVIGNDLYVDGGYYDNLPINLAIELGATKIVAVDLRAVGFKKKIIDESTLITYISPRNKIAPFLVFDGMESRQSIRFGYNDTMKTFGKLDGDKFTFRKNNLIKNYNRYNDLYEENLNSLFNGVDNIIFNRVFSLPLFKDVLNRKTLYRNFNHIVEKSGKIFGFDEAVIYNIRAFNKGLVNELSCSEPVASVKIFSKIKNGDVKGLIDSRQVVKYFYNSIISGDETMFKYILMFQDEFLTALYIYTVKGNKIVY